MDPELGVPSNTICSIPPLQNWNMVSGILDATGEFHVLTNNVATVFTDDFGSVART